MPDRRAHRSAAPGDRELFAPSAVPRLARATADLSWLLGRGYAERSSLKLVGDRCELVARQREAVGRSACSEEAATGAVVASADRDVLDGCRTWINLAREVVGWRVPRAWCANLSGSPADSAFEE